MSAVIGTRARSSHAYSRIDEKHRLSVKLPVEVPPGPVKVIIQLLGDECEEDDRSWSRAIAQAWAADWNDPREDIYTLQAGEAVDASR